MLIVLYCQHIPNCCPHAAFSFACTLNTIYFIRAITLHTRLVLFRVTGAYTAFDERRQSTPWAFLQFITGPAVTVIFFMSVYATSYYPFNQSNWEIRNWISGLSGCLVITCELLKMICKYIFYKWAATQKNSILSKAI